VLTEPLHELSAGASLPNVRDPDFLVYARQDDASLVLGGYEPNPKTFEVEAIPLKGDPSQCPFQAARFEALLAVGRERFPMLAEAKLIKKVNGLESFTPDGEFILGEAPEIRGFWVACGFCAHGISGAGGVGKAMAEWIIQGEPSLDMWHMDIRRFGRFATSRRYATARTTEVYSTYYSLTIPGTEKKSTRNLRLSPVYGRLKELGAVFGEKSGWERANWFTANEPLAHKSDWPRPRGWAGQLWSPAIGAEHEATRERIALFDETSFSKIEVQGPGALSALERITTNHMDRPLGTITYTQLLNQRGGIQCDLTVTRLEDDRFQIITGTAFGAHDLAWIRRHLPSDGTVQARDTTSSSCCLGVWGPLARDLLQQVSEDDFSNLVFPYMTARQVTVGEIPVLACRVTYVGELGWELYAPMEYGLKLWDTLWQAGQPMGLVAAGYRAIDSLRLEKGYRYWSADIDAEHNPFEAGLCSTVKLEKGEFLGRDALRRAQSEGIRRKLCALVLDDPIAVALGGEPILDGRYCVGRVTSGGFGYTVRQSIAYGYLPCDSAIPGTILQVELFGNTHSARVVAEPLYDPTNEKVKR
jgi:glycine cleavage system aminomethyltransferase T